MTDVPPLCSCGRIKGTGHIYVYDELRKVTNDKDLEIDRIRNLLGQAEWRMNDPDWRSAVWEALECPGNNPSEPFKAIAILEEE